MSGYDLDVIYRAGWGTAFPPTDPPAIIPDNDVEYLGQYGSGTNGTCTVSSDTPFSDETKNVFGILLVTVNKGSGHTATDLTGVPTDDQAVVPGVCFDPCFDTDWYKEVAVSGNSYGAITPVQPVGIISHKYLSYALEAGAAISYTLNGTAVGSMASLHVFKGGRETAGVLDITDSGSIAAPSGAGAWSDDIFTNGNQGVALCGFFVPELDVRNGATCFDGHVAGGWVPSVPNMTLIDTHTITTGVARYYPNVPFCTAPSTFAFDYPVYWYWANVQADTGNYDPGATGGGTPAAAPSGIYATYHWSADTPVCC